MKAWYALPRFRAGSPFRPWLLAIVANEARNRRRSAAGARPWRCGSPRTAPRGTRPRPPRRRRWPASSGPLLLAASARLREDDRQVIACRYFLELSEAEMAAALGCRPGTVKSRLSRALDRLRAVLAEQGTAAAPTTLPGGDR